MTDQKEMPAGENGRHQTGTKQEFISIPIISESNVQFKNTGEWLRAVKAGQHNPVNDNPRGDPESQEHEITRCVIEGAQDGIEGAIAVITKLETGYLAETMAQYLTDPNADAWQYFGLADAYEERPPLEYLIDGMLPLPSLSIMYGAPGDMKSMLAADAAVCVAGGIPWLPPLEGKDDVTARPTLQAPVLWVDFDNGRRRCHERFGALARARNLSPDTPLHYVSFPTPWLDASLDNALEVMTQRVQRLGIKLLIIDNLGQVSGNIEENSAGMSGVLATFRQLAENNGIAVILIHHQRKGGANGARGGDALRGHSSIEAALDLALHVHRDPNAETIEIRSTKTRDVDVHPFGAMFTHDWRHGTKELYNAMFYGWPVADDSSDYAIERAITDIVADTPGINNGDLTNAVKAVVTKAGVNRISNMIKIMRETGKIRLDTGDRGAHKYYLES